MVQERFDAIVVGAGPSGTSAAITMAKAGLKVIIFERGEKPGAKNLMGGVLYREPTEKIFPEFWKEAPIERTLMETNYWFMTDKAATKIGYRTQDFMEEPYNSFTVLRAKWDKWAADQAVKAGALLICETVVEEVIKEDGKVVGVKTGRENGNVYADVVVISEGANSLLTQDSVGMQKTPLPDNHFIVFAKEVISLPPETIEARFALEEGMGATIDMFGDTTNGMFGTSFLYTNNDTVSLGVGALISQLRKNQVNPNDLMEKLKQHPAVRPLIEGGERKEYLAHMIPEGGYNAIPKLYDAGVVVVGDAAQLVNGLHREGSNLAITSGKIAGETIVAAFKKGDFSADALSSYDKNLRDTFVIKDLEKYKNVIDHFEENNDLFTVYPEFMSMALQEFFTVNSVSKKEKQKIIMKNIFDKRSKWQLGKELFNIWRVLK